MNLLNKLFSNISAIDSKFDSVQTVSFNNSIINSESFQGDPLKLITRIGYKIGRMVHWQIDLM